MGVKEMLKQNFSKDESIVLERYKASKFAFIIISFLFFLNFYFVGAKFYLNFFGNSLGIIYILLLFSLAFYIYFFIKKIYIGKINNILFILLGIMLLIFIFLGISPLLIDGGLNSIIEFIKSIK